MHCMQSVLLRIITRKAKTKQKIPEIVRVFNGTKNDEFGFLERRKTNMLFVSDFMRLFISSTHEITKLIKYNGALSDGYLPSFDYFVNVQA